MKITIYILTILFLLCSCKKYYEDAPFLGVKKRHTHLEGEWHVEQITRDGIDITQKYIDSCNFNIKILDDWSSYQHGSGSTGCIMSNESNQYQGSVSYRSSIPDLISLVSD